MAYQFIHYETYNATEARKEIGEGMRLEGSCPHVENPQKPTVLYGSTDGLADKIDALKASTKRQITQKTRSGEVKTFERPLRDSENVALFGVVSWPREWSQQNPRLFEESKKKTLNKLKKDFGGQLQAVIFHDDEDHPHLHFWVIPEKLDMSNVCPAFAAEKNLDKKRDKSTGKERAAVRLQALKDFQLEWHHEVFASAGLAKEGPKRRRMTRVEYMAEKETLNTVAKINMKADDTRINTAGLAGAMLIQNAKHKADIASMDAKASTMLQGLTNAQRIEVAKQQKAAEVVQDLLGL
jgi:hypothetical protein